MRVPLAAGIAIGLLALCAACGGTAPTGGGGSSSSGSSAGGGAGNPKDDGYACGLLTKDQISSVTGGPPKDFTHVTATVSQGVATTSCTADSVAPCPQNLSRDSPYCKGAYRIDWQVGVYDSGAAAKAGFASLAPQAGTPVTDVRADQAAQDNSPRSMTALKGKVVIQVDYLAPGNMSGNPATLPTASPEQGTGLHKLARMILAGAG
jgi:hypothetical protein